MKKYVTPTLDTIVFSGKDILAQSEVLIDGTDLFGEQN